MTTADGTYTGPRAGETITTADQLDALPVGSVVRDRFDDEATRQPTRLWAFPETAHQTSAYVAKHYAPLMVLFRPDAPQPATTDDGPTWDDATVQRAVQAACAEAGWDWEPEPGVLSPADSMRPIVVAALSIAMPHPAESQWQSATFYGKPDGGLALSPREAAARSRRTDMEIAIDSVITAHPALKHEDSQEADENYGDLLNELVDAVLAARDDATAPTGVEWGVRDSRGDIATFGSDRDEAEVYAEAPGGDLIQRTVSVWREVEGGEQP